MTREEWNAAYLIGFLASGEGWNSEFPHCGDEWLHDDHWLKSRDKTYEDRTMTEVDSTSDDRTVNNTLRHKYRVLSDADKAQMQAVKDKGAEFLALIETLRTPSVPMGTNDDGIEMATWTFDRELNIASERIEEAVMWAVKHVTA